MQARRCDRDLQGRVLCKLQLLEKYVKGGGDKSTKGSENSKSILGQIASRGVNIGTNFLAPYCKQIERRKQIRNIVVAGWLHGVVHYYVICLFLERLQRPQSKNCPRMPRMPHAGDDFSSVRDRRITDCRYTPREMPNSPRSTRYHTQGNRDGHRGHSRCDLVLLVQDGAESVADGRIKEGFWSKILHWVAIESCEGSQLLREGEFQFKTWSTPVVNQAVFRG